MTYHLDRRRLWLVGLPALVLLNIGNAASLYALYVIGADFALGLVPLFNFDTEGNFPTLFNGLLLLLAGLISWAISDWRRRGGLPFWKSWLGLSLILLFLFLDETCGIHDVLHFILLARVESSGVIDWPWVIPYGLLALVVARIYLRFFLALKRRHQIGFSVAALLYLGGAIGLEMLAASHVEQAGEDLGFGIYYTIEENLEILGCLVACSTLLDLIKSEQPDLEATFQVR